MSVLRSMVRMALSLAGIAVVLSSVARCGNEDAGPKVSWSSPADGAEVFGIARLKVKASSSEGVSEVKFYCDSVSSAHLIGTITSPVDSLYTQAWYTTTVQNGEHTLHAVAVDAKGKSAQASRTLTVGNVTRAMAIADKVTWTKWTPQSDAHPPVLDADFSQYFYAPEQLGGPINTPGAEDSPFITPDGNNLYFFFTPDMNIDATKQLLDRVTGIYWSQKTGSTWSEPQRVWLNYYDDPALDGAQTILGNTMWFASVRAGVKREIDLYSAELVDGRWSNWTNLGEPLNVEYQVGELHISADGNHVYFHSRRPGGKGGMDIWVTSKVDGQWQTPQNVAAVNTEYDDGYPYLSEDGNELWFNRNYAIYRSVRSNGEWQAPEMVVSPLAGEPTLDRQGNLYFVHHFYDDSANKIWEADIYVCRRK
ncbi:MAG: Ig-like domain-containing protein [Dehalococcoidia bacterium]|nr:Ig-like domain-containing protein [Dehalococcoidia bacterium]